MGIPDKFESGPPKKHRQKRSRVGRAVANLHPFRRFKHILHKMSISQSDFGMPVPTKAEKLAYKSYFSVDVSAKSNDSKPNRRAGSDASLPALPGFDVSSTEVYAPESTTQRPSESLITNPAPQKCRYWQQQAENRLRTSPAPVMIQMSGQAGHEMMHDLAFSLGYVHTPQHQVITEPELPPMVNMGALPPPVSVSGDPYSLKAVSGDPYLGSLPGLPPQPVSELSGVLPEIVRHVCAQDDTPFGTKSPPPATRKRKRRRRNQDKIGFARIRNSKRIKVGTLEWGSPDKPVIYMGVG